MKLALVLFAALAIAPLVSAELECYAQFYRNANNGGQSFQIGPLTVSDTSAPALLTAPDWRKPFKKGVFDDRTNSAKVWCTGGEAADYEKVEVRLYKMPFGKAADIKKYAAKNKAYLPLKCAVQEDGTCLGKLLKYKPGWGAASGAALIYNWPTYKAGQKLPSA